MADVTDIATELVTHIETTFGAGTLLVEPDAAEDLPVGSGMLVGADSYSLERLEFRQDLITYTFAMVFKRSAADGSKTARDTMSDDLEAVRATIRSNETLNAKAHDARVSTILVQTTKDGAQVIGSMAIEVEVIDG